MTYLQLVQATWRILGHSDDEIADLNDNDGVKGDVIKAVADAWIEIQRYRNRDWKFLRDIEDFETVAYQTDYVIGTDIFTGTSPSAASTAFGEWDEHMIIYNGKALLYYNYDYFMTKYRDYDGYKLDFDTGAVAEFSVGEVITGSITGVTAIISEGPTVSAGTFAGGNAEGYLYVTNATGTFTTADTITGTDSGGTADLTTVTTPESGEPEAFTIDPSTDALILNSPDDVYAIHAHYRTSPQSLSSASDVPTNLPVQFHMAIVYKAISDLGGPHFGAGELSDYYGMKYKQAIGEIMRSQNPARVVRKRPIA